ncbi:sciellin isoform X2 [Pseudoliparis swirei]|uniref:sciellin isoform X2 n=1 Tax=Pseudoliparis swirei TaxID=2059687 RepID=UPI0024BEEC76|nr:sciellin isoform X2 [Pseudoliparis swirei]
MSRYSTSKSSSLLKDGSWIKRVDDEDEDVDRDPNFGKSVLSQRGDAPAGPEGNEPKTTGAPSKSTSVLSLSKRFGGSQDELSAGTITTTTVTEEPKTWTPRKYSNGSTSETTTSHTVSSYVVKSPTKTETFTERVKSSSKGPQYSSYSPTRTTKVTETPVFSPKDAGNQPSDTYVPSAIKDDYSPTDSKTSVFASELVMAKRSPDAEDKLFSTLLPSSGKEDYSSTDRNSFTTPTKTRSYSTAEDDLYSTLLPRSITSVSDRTSPTSSTSSSRGSSINTTKREIITVESSNGVESSLTPSSIRSTSYSSYNEDLPSTRTTSYSVSSTPSEDYSSDQKSYSYSRPDSSYEYSSISSPTNTYDSKTYRSSSRLDDTDLIYSSSRKSAYVAPERAVLQKDLCTYCHKPFTGDAKMILDDMKINCHASCFKCEVCSNTLGHMKAGDSMWIYKRMVHCENCFDVTRDKWHR